MDKFGLIGHPIDHSRSPELFRMAYDGRYEYDLIHGEDFESSWQKFLDGYRAINITTPFKDKAFAKADILTPECIELEATNLVVKTPEGTKAYNSDYRGVRKVLLDHGFKAGQKALVIGFGGAGRAAAAAAKSIGMQTTVCNRSLKTPDIHPLDEIPAIAQEADIVIYTLATEIPQAAQMKARCIFEANYRCPILKGKSPEYIPGEEWLTAQAVTGYELMTGEVPNNLTIL